MHWHHNSPKEGRDGPALPCATLHYPLHPWPPQIIFSLTTTAHTLGKEIFAVFRNGYLMHKNWTWHPEHGGIFRAWQSPAKHCIPGAKLPAEIGIWTILVARFCIENTKAYNLLAMFFTDLYRGLVTMINCVEFRDPIGWDSEHTR